MRSACQILQVPLYLVAASNRIKVSTAAMIADNLKAQKV
jgi:hypothetical protein